MLWSLVNLIDVYFVNDVYQDEYDGTIISGLFPIFPWIFVVIGFLPFQFPHEQWPFFFLSGGLFLMANFFYFRSLFRKNDAVLIQILWNLTVPLTLIFSWLLVHEKLLARQYVGITVVLFGITYLSLQEKSDEWNIKEVLKNSIPASIFLALSLVVSGIAYKGSDVSFMSGYLVFSLGMVAVALLINVLSKKSFKERISGITTLSKKYFMVFFFAELLALAGTITSQRAINLSPSSSFVATIESLSPIFVMIFSLLIVFFGKTILRGRFDVEALYLEQTGSLRQKLVAIVTVAIGIYLVS